MHDPPERTNSTAKNRELARGAPKLLSSLHDAPLHGDTGEARGARKARASALASAGHGGAAVGAGAARCVVTRASFPRERSEGQRVGAVGEGPESTSGQVQ